MKPHPTLAPLSFEIVSVAVLLTMLNSPLALAQSQNTTTTYGYDTQGNLQTVQDPLGNIDTYAYDALNRVRQANPKSATTNGYQPPIYYGFDGRDFPLTVTDQRNLLTTSTIDGLGNQTALSSPDTGVTNNTYDVAGNLLTSTDARGKTRTYSYDVLNRLRSIAYTTGAATAFEYDGGSSGAPNAIGHLTRVTDESGQTAYAYDAFGRVLSKVQTVGSANVHTYAVAFAYGTAGNVTGKRISLTYPSGNRISYLYDAAGRINALTLNPALADGSTDTMTSIPLLTGIVYAPFGGVSGWIWGNSTDLTPNVSTRSFDLDGRLTSTLMGNAANNGLTRTIAYDAASRITSTTHTGMGSGAAAPANFNQSYVYDNLSRLTSFAGNATTQAFQYDYVGNRTRSQFGSTAYTLSVASNSNRLSSAGGPLPAKTYSYDTAGNLLGDGVNTFSYSDRGRRTSTINAGGTTSYLYNGLEERVRKSGPSGVVSTGTNDYVYDAEGKLIGEYDANGAPLEETVYLDGLPVAVLKPTATAPIQVNVYYVHADQINTARVITQASDNQIVWRWDNTDPFGLVAPDENPNNLGVFTYSLRFPGQVYDNETGLYYNNFRDYDPQVGRYIESDPIGLAGGINTYAYVGGNPISSVDPSGLLVTGTYDRSTGKLILRDIDKGTTISGQFESGGKPWGDPIPNGQYDILARAGRDGFFRLEPVDSNYGDDTDDRTGRDHFRLHHPGRTQGCIAAKDEQNWNNVENFINSTRTDNAQVNSMSRSPWGPKTETLPRYGRINVVN